MQNIQKLLEINPILSQILILLLGMISSYVITRLLIPEIIKISDVYKLHDKPDNRKIHTSVVPTFGGVAMFVGFIISVMVWVFSNHISNVQYLIGAIVVIVVVGMRDDFLSLRAKWKLVGQTGAAFLIMFFGETHFKSLYGFLEIYELNIIVSFLITWFTIIVITNAFNLIDGINGLAGTVGIIVFGFYGVWFFYNQSYVMSILCFNLVGSCLGFLKYNYKGKIFMGDTGSLLLGFLASATTIIFINENAQPENPFYFSNPVTLTSCVLVYPLFDTLRVFVIRVSEKRSPFSADRNHIHHLLLKTGLSHLKATGVICVCSLIFLVFAVLTRHFSDNILIPIVVLVAYFLSKFLEKKAKQS